MTEIVSLPSFAVVPEGYHFMGGVYGPKAGTDTPLILTTNWNTPVGHKCTSSVVEIAWLESPTYWADHLMQLTIHVNAALRRAAEVAW